MKIRIAYYVVALAISLAAFTGAYGYTYPARAAAAAMLAAAAAMNATAAKAAYNTAAYNTAAYDAAADVVYKANARALIGAYRAVDAAVVYTAAARTAYALAGAVSLAAFAGAYILDKRRDA